MKILKKEKPERRKRDILSGLLKFLIKKEPQKLDALRIFASGLLSSLALPPFFLFPVLWLSIPFFLGTLSRAKKVKTVILYGFLYGFGAHIVGLYWITEAVLLESSHYWWLVPFAVPAIAAFLAVFIIPPAICAFLIRRPLAKITVFSAVWALSELARQFVLGGFPWNPLGGDVAFPGHIGTVFIQPAAYIGVTGLTFLVVLLAALPFAGKKGLSLAVLMTVLWAGFGMVRLAVLPKPTPLNLEAVVIQANIPEKAKLNMTDKTANAIFRKYLYMTRKGVTAAPLNRPKVVIWPEDASPFLLRQSAQARADIAYAAGDYTPVLAGTVTLNKEGRPQNSLVVIMGPGPVLATYNKWKLVPFGEYQPSWFFLPIQLIPGGGFAPGPGPETITVPGLPPFGPMICYEVVFSGEIVSKKRRPDWLADITNDAWFGDSPGPYQDLAAARLRAVEEGLPLVQASNTGVSTIFTAFGQETAKIALGKSGILTEQVPGPLKDTLFAQFGLEIPLILLIFIVILGIIL